MWDAHSLGREDNMLRTIQVSLAARQDLSKSTDFHEGKVHLLAWLQYWNWTFFEEHLNHIVQVSLMCVPSNLFPEEQSN